MLLFGVLHLRQLERGFRGVILLEAQNHKKQLQQHCIGSTADIISCQQQQLSSGSISKTQAVGYNTE